MLESRKLVMIFLKVDFVIKYLLVKRELDSFKREFLLKVYFCV